MRHIQGWFGRDDSRNLTQSETLGRVPPRVDCDALDLGSARSGTVRVIHQASAAAAWSNQAPPARQHHCLDTIVCSQLPEDRLDVRLDRVLAEVDLGGYLTVRIAARHQS